MTRKLKLYVWRGVLCDWTCGMICVLASDSDEAELLAHRELVTYNEDTTLDPPEIYEVPTAVSIYGGG